MFDSLVYRKEVDKSLLYDGVTLPREFNKLFGMSDGRMLERGETKPVKLYINGREYTAKIVNMNNRADARKNDQYQIRYSPGSEFSVALRSIFHHSWAYIEEKYAQKEKGSRARIKLPEGQKEYLAIYATEYEDTYLLEPLTIEEIDVFNDYVSKKDERVFESDFLYRENDISYDVEFQEMKDPKATVEIKNVYTKVRKLDVTIGKHLKRLYSYRCQICGRLIGEEYGCEHVVEAHHIDYFVKSLDNNSSNQLIVCPNHHSIIHECNPVFDRSKLMYIYDNGYEEGLKLNRHLSSEESL